MTTESYPPPTPRVHTRRKRPHPASTARTVAAGAASVATCTLVAAFGLAANRPDGVAAAAATSAPVLQDALGTTSRATATPPSTSFGTSRGDLRTSTSPSLGVAGRTAPSTRSSSS